VLTIGLCFFCRGLTRRVNVGHLERFSSVDEQSQVIVGELVFVRAKFISEGVGFRVMTSGGPVTGRFLKAAIQDRISLPPRYQEATTCPVRNSSRLNKGHITSSR